MGKAEYQVEKSAEHRGDPADQDHNGVRLRHEIDQRRAALYPGSPVLTIQRSSSDGDQAVEANRESEGPHHRPGNGDLGSAHFLAEGGDTAIPGVCHEEERDRREKTESNRVPVDWLTRPSLSQGGEREYQERAHCHYDEDRIDNDRAFETGQDERCHHNHRRASRYSGIPRYVEECRHT